MCIFKSNKAIFLKLIEKPSNMYIKSKVYELRPLEEIILNLLSVFIYL